MNISVLYLVLGIVVALLLLLVPRLSTARLTKLGWEPQDIEGHRLALWLYIAPGALVIGAAIGALYWSRPAVVLVGVATPVLALWWAVAPYLMGFRNRSAGFRRIVVNALYFVVILGVLVAGLAQLWTLGGGALGNDWRGAGIRPDHVWRIVVCISELQLVTFGIALIGLLAWFRVSRPSRKRLIVSLVITLAAAAVVCFYIWELRDEGNFVRREHGKYMLRLR